MYAIRSYYAWNSIASPNIRRFNAGSAVGPDGRWYVFGGTTLIVPTSGSPYLAPVATTEVYDPTTNTWTSLSQHYNLGSIDNNTPNRAWPRGGVVGDTIWVLGVITSYSIHYTKLYEAPR